jgi:hypothetical protein
MKTPREILLQRHRAATPRLDAVRAVVVNELNNKETKEQSSTLVSLFLHFFTTPWHELILPSRRIWVGLAAAWVLIFVAHLACRENEPVIAKKSAPPSREVLIVLREQNELRTQLLRDDSKPAEADRPKPAALPHSELQRSTLIA